MNLFFTVFLLTARAFASDGVGAHGGNVILCQGKPTVTLDYYNAALPTPLGPADIIDVESMTFDQVVEFFSNRLVGTALGLKLERAAEVLGKFNSWRVADIKDIDDANEPYIPAPNCERKTGAIRQGDFIYLDRTILPQLSQAQRALLYLHELLYFIKGGDSSQPIREFFSVALKREIEEIPWIAAVRKISGFYLYEI